MKTLLFALALIATTHHAAELWRGTLYLAGDKRMTGTIEDVRNGAIKFICKGDVHWFKIADLPSATRGEIGLGTDADVAAYRADLPRRQALMAADQAKARATQDRARAAREADRRALSHEQAQREKKQAEMQAFQQREEKRRQTEAIEQIALELQLRRLNGNR